MVELSKTENTVAYLLVSTFKTNQEIADELFVEEKTVKFHITNIYSKLFVKTRAELTHKYTKYDFESDNKGVAVNNELPTMFNGQKKAVVANEDDSQRNKINFIDDKFKVGKSIDQLHNMMMEVTKDQMTAANVNAACNCVSRINETINTAISAARFLSGR